jgi:hypothetical protein
MLPTFKAIPQVMFCMAFEVTRRLSFHILYRQKWVPLRTDLMFGKRHVRRKRLELWRNGWILHQDNAPAHNALDVKQILAN